MRIACFFVPLFPLAARLRSEPELHEQAVVITEGNGSAAHVVAASRRARKNGIHAGQSLAQARVILPKLIARARDPECERSAQEALLESAESLSPRVEDSGEGLVYLDLTGLERHYERGMRNAESGMGFEAAFAQVALRGVEAAGLPARVGVASSKLAARVAAELPDTPVIVPEGDEAAFLAQLPLARLAPEIAIGQTLQRWGITSVGELARLPEAEVAARLGEPGRQLHAAARGLDPRPLIPRQVPPLFEEGMELEWPIVSLEPFLFVGNAALDRLAKRLEARGYSCRRLEIELRLEPDGFYNRLIELPAPTRDVKAMLALLRLDIEANPPGGPVAAFRLIAHPDRPRRAQLSLFGPPALSPDRLSAAIARIASIVGRDRIGSPVVVDTHAPERFALAPFAPPPPPEVRRPPRKGRGLLAARTIRPPVEIEVDTAHLAIGGGDDDTPPDTRLKRIRSVGSREVMTSTNRPLRIEGEVRVASGPWLLEEGWWAETPVTREYWDIEVAGGALYRVYRNVADGRWFADAMYD